MRGGLGQGMRARVPIATVGGLLFIAAWIAGATVLGDAVRGLHPVLQFAYYAVAGFVWVFPIRWLMLWSVGKR